MLWAQITEEGKCVNTCRFARDGSCDDKRASGLCADGTDCQDCGPWAHGNFTDVRENTLDLQRLRARSCLAYPSSAWSCFGTTVVKDFLVFTVYCLLLTV